MNILSPFRARSLAFMLSIGASAFALSGQADARSIKFAMGAPVLTLDPGVAAGTQAQTVRIQVMEPLVQMNAETGKIEPLLAESWSLADDKKTWTFKLRPGVKFHDGTPLTSADVVASLSRIIDPKSGLGRAADLRAISEVTPVDDLTVKLTTAAPFGALLQVLALDSASILSAASLKADAAKIGWNPVGTGPFKYVSHQAEQSVTLARNDAYWGTKPAAEGIQFITVPEAATRLSMLETGEADIVTDVPGSEIERLQSTPDIALLKKPNTRVGHIGINVSKPPFTDARVRQALNFAVDREAIAEGVLRGLGIPAETIIAPPVFGYAPQKLYSYDPKKAKALLTEAGFPNGFKTTIWTPQGRYYMDRETVIAVQAQLKEIGVDASVEIVDWSTYLAALRKPQAENKSELYMLGWETGTADIQIILDTVFDSARMPPNGWDTMFYKNPDVDALRVEIGREVDPDKRLKLAADAQALIMKDAPWVPLYSYIQVTGYRKNITGLEYLATDVYRLKNIKFN
ncbi:MAG: hypothetical protein KF735_11250 [Chelatococcus sp.]|uniref:ABC transporter substrate-binding protein n=1 Tax=unclassified Chelatococcus TaxID=2638111 RepID=UPI001BCDE2C8|nr:MULTISPECIES: ABC transporter substrate-binding protein [unclassified Chelatococcus]CAH1648720.1 Glutathione ABC transporter substrate-binding protein [Hyphomicrobiales bacterium]MBS7741879.1 hypothetical protein [Chelatococcus sp. HY11]MBX3538210.1 hypothetical protein [Chelatococcus sp.]MBX3541323.1 hypothetical protein [Chelatococcus sp.]MCO5074784.1 ABC transporter substrate-binding protein [Chelatococcus sp.]